MNKPTKHYHSTPAGCLQEIMQKGLNSAENYLHDETHGYNSFISDLLGSNWVASLEINVDGLDLEPGPDGPGTYTVKRIIEPWRIKLLGMQCAEPQVWVPFSGFVPDEWAPERP